MTLIICVNPNCGVSLSASDTRCSRCGTPVPSIPVSALTLDVPAETLMPESALLAITPSVISRIGRFEIREQLGEGSFGIVYRAFDPHLNREIALKVAKPEQLSTFQRVQRFLQEARSAAKLTHPNIVLVHDAGQDGEIYYIAQRFINGPSLDRVLQDEPNERMECSKAVEIVRKLADALDHAHQSGIIHRDIKPGNILLETRMNGTTEPLLTDFGLAAFTDEGAERLTQEGERFMGTPAFMAPEQAHGNATSASDQYSLGITFYQLMTGRTPFDGPPTVQIMHHQSSPIPSPRSIERSIPLDLETICLKCLEKNPSARYASCAELAADLRRWQDGEPVFARRLGTIGRFSRWVKRNPGIAGALFMVILSLTLGAGFAIRYGVRAESARESEEKVTIELKKSLRESKERLYLAELRLDSARLLKAQDYWNQGDTTSAIGVLNSCRSELRGWEHGHLRHRFAQSDFTLRGHSDTVRSVSFSPDGTLFATASFDNTAKVWDARTGEVLLTFKGHTSEVVCLSFSPDGTRIVTGSGDETAKVWDVRTGEEQLTFRRHMGAVKCVSFSPDGTRIVTGSGDETAKVWDARTGEERLSLEGHDDRVSGAAFSPDGICIVTTSWDRMIKVWDARTGKEKRTLTGHKGTVKCVSFSPDGTSFVTGSSDGTARVWDTTTGEQRLIFRGHKSTICSVVFSPDGTQIATTSSDNTAKVWNARTGEVRLMLKGHTQDVESVSFSPDGRRILTASEDQTVKMWDTRTGEERSTFKGHTGTVTEANFSPDGTLIVTGSSDNMAKVWDARTGEERLTLTGHRSSVTSVTFSPDGTRIVTGSDDGTAKVWDVRTGVERLTFKGHIRPERLLNWVKCVSFSPDGKYVITGSEDNTAKVWDADTGEERLTLEGHTAYVSDVNFSPDGTLIITASRDETAKVWDATTGELRLTLMADEVNVISASFSPDGTQILTAGGDGTKVWDARTGERRLTLSDTGGVETASFSPDGMLIVTGSSDNTATLWDARTGEERLILKGHTNSVECVSFSPDGTRIVTGSYDNTAKVWDTEAGDVEAERRREYLTRLARFDAFWHDRQARDAEKLNDSFAAEFHLRLLVEHAPDHLEWHQRRAKALVALKRDAVVEEKIIAQLKASPPELIAAPHLEPLPTPGPRAKIKLFNPPPPNFDAD